MRFPAIRKTLIVQKHPAISRQEKRAFCSPRQVALGLTSFSPIVCADRRLLTSQPKFLASIGYQSFLPIVLRWRTSPAEAPL